MDGWYGRLFEGMGLPMDKPIASFTKKQLETMLYAEPTKIKVEGINLTFEGIIPKIQKSMLSKDVEAMQPHVRRFVERAITFQSCPECEGTRLSKEARSSRIKGKNIADLCTMQISDLADVGARRSTSRRSRRCSRGCSTRSTRSPRSASATSRSTVRPARCPGERPSAPR